MSTPRTTTYLQTAPSDAVGVAEPFPEEEARQRESERARQRQYRERQAARENAAEGQLHLADGYDCPLCRNRGYISVVEEYRGFYDVAMRLCSCRQVRKTLKTLRRNGLDRLAETYTLDNFIVSQPWQRTILSRAEGYLAAFARGERPWFFFGGTSGCGKTHICTALAITLLREGHAMRYMLWRDEAARIKGSMSDGGYAAEVDKLKKTPLLYIDDLFKTGRGESQHRQRPTPADLNLAFEILNYRYNTRRPTIISSESLLQEIIGFDDAIGGRIKEMCGEFFLNIAEDRAKNYRLR